MSEQVIANLDHMVAPLKDLMDKGIFEPDEIRSSTYIIISNKIKRENNFYLTNLNSNFLTPPVRF